MVASALVRHRRSLPVMLILVMGFAPTAWVSGVSAATYTWQAVSDDWMVASNWGGILPTSSDTALVGGGTATIANSWPTCSTLDIGGAAGPGGVLLTAGSLNVGSSLFVGDSTTGTFTQSGGVFSGPTYLILGNNLGSSGNYNLSGGSLAVWQNQYIGYSGSGTFIQTGGTNEASDGNTFYLGYNPGSSGTYNLSGGLLGLWQKSLVVGSSGTGTFTQSGGSNPGVGDLWLGANSGGSGTYNLSGGLLATFDCEYVGCSGAGVFTQTGGTNSASLVLGESYGGVGTYTLSGSGLLSAKYEEVGGWGAGSFSQSGGTNSVSSGLYLGECPGASGTYNLSGSGVLSAAQEYLAPYGSSATATFAQTGGSNSTAYLSIGGGGKYLLAGGTLQLTPRAIFLGSGTLDGGNGAGTLSIAGSSIVDLTQGTIANTGSMALVLGPASLTIVPPGMGLQSFGSVNGAGFFHTSGTSLSVPAGNGFTGSGTINDFVGCQGWIQAFAGPINLTAGLSVSGTATVNLSNGTLTTQDATSGISGGFLTAACQRLAPTGTGVFTQSGGYSSIVNLWIGSGGKYVLSGGTLDVLCGGLVLAGTLDGGNTAGVLKADNDELIDFSQGVLANTGSMSMSIGQGSLLVLSSTMNPKSLFGHFSNAGMTHILGTALSISAGTGFAGAGVISDPVTCLGYITAENGTLTFAGGLNIAGSGSVNLGSGTLTTENASSGLSGGSLGAAANFVGVSGTGVFTQSGAVESQPVYLGFNLGSSGAYNLTGGRLTAPQYIGYSGRGSFAQSGGTNSPGGSHPSIYLGYNPGSSGTYNLSGGSLYAASQYIGFSGTGAFTQSGGTNSVRGSNPDLYLGYNPGSSGSYNLSGGSLDCLWGSLVVGSSGTGTFTQSGGTNSSGGLLLGYNYGSSGSYNLSGGSLWTVGQFVGYSGYGAFTQSAGTNSSSNLSLGYYSGSSGSYNLSGGRLSGSEVVGGGGSATGTFAQSGGTNAATSLSLGSGSRSMGTYSLSGGSLFASNEYVGFVNSGTGAFTQTGGTNSVSGGLYLSYFSNSIGAYNLNGGLLALGGLLNPSGSGAYFSFSGGTLRSNGSFSTSIPITLPTSGGTATFDTPVYSITLSGLLTGPGGIAKSSVGTLVLAAPNTYSGDTSILAGTLQLGNALALQNSTVDLSAGASLNLGGFSATLGGLRGNGNLAMGSGTLAVGNNSKSTTYSGQLSGAGSLKKIGSGSLALSGSNGYTGTTSIDAGTLIASTTVSLPNLLTASPKVSVAAGATLILPAGGTAGYTSANIATMLSSSSLFAFGANLGLDTSGGSIALSTKNGLGIIKLGPNLMIVSGTNSVGGNFSVGGGTLQLGSTSAMPGGASVSVASGATFDMQGASNAPSASPGTLSTENGTIRIGPAAFGDVYFGALAMTGGTVDCSGAGDYWLHVGGASPTITTSAAGTTAILAGANAQLTNDGLTPLVFNVAAGTTPSGIDLDVGLELTPGASRYFVKSGLGVMRLTNSGDSAWLTVAQGKLRVDDPTLSALGSGPLTLDGGTLLYGNATTGGTTAKAIGIGGGGGTIEVGSGLTLSGNITGTGELVKTGHGMLVLSGTNTFSGGLLVDDGAMQILGSDAIPSGANLNVGTATSLFSADLPAGYADARTAVAVPEPGALLLLFTGAAMFVAKWRVRRSIRRVSHHTLQTGILIESE